MPLWNEQDVLGLLFERLGSVFSSEACERCGIASVRYVFVDDGSRDQRARTVADAIAAGLPAVLYRFSRNFGHQNAVSAGLAHDRDQHDHAPGLVVILEGCSRYWRVSGAQGSWPVLRAYGRYWAIPTPGGHHALTAAYRPSWLPSSLAVSGIGLALAVVLTALGEVQRVARARGGLDTPPAAR